MENNDDERLNYYISIGAIEVAGIDADGEFIFEITERAREVAPELWQAHEQHVDQSLLRMFEMGLVDVTYDENLEAHLELIPLFRSHTSKNKLPLITGKIRHRSLNKSAI